MQKTIVAPLLAVMLCLSGCIGGATAEDSNGKEGAIGTNGWAQSASLPDCGTVVAGQEDAAHACFTKAYTECNPTKAVTTDATGSELYLEIRGGTPELCRIYVRYDRMNYRLVKGLFPEIEGKDAVCTIKPTSLSHLWEDLLQGPRIRENCEGSLKDYVELRTSELESEQPASEPVPWNIN